MLQRVLTQRVVPPQPLRDVCVAQALMSIVSKIRAVLIKALIYYDVTVVRPPLWWQGRNTVLVLRSQDCGCAVHVATHWRVGTGNAFIGVCWGLPTQEPAPGRTNLQFGRFFALY